VATFSNLYYATELLSSQLHTALGASVIAAPPPESPGDKEEIYLSLTYAAEQPAHKNDGWVSKTDGTLAPPPVILSVFYLLTTYGSTGANSAEGAHRLLGDATRYFHEVPKLDLAAVGVPSSKGEGELSVSVVPMTPELMEKLFSTLRHRPFLFLEAAPVQLISRQAAKPAAPVVWPGGVRLAGPRPMARVAIARVAPDRPAQGGYLRIDGPFPAPVSAVAVGQTILTGGAVAPVGSLSTAVRVQLPQAQLPPAVYPVHVVLADGTASESLEIQVHPAGSSSLDAPASPSYSLALPPLALAGQGLAQVDRVFFWPDAGIFAPSDVRDFAATGVGPTALQVTPALTPGTYRAAARVQPGGGRPSQFTPHVVIEVTP
jgi:hypothetical protein